jgi:protocatechuate 3,4-dioxygenase beta subunit
MRKVLALVLGFWLMLGIALPAAAAEPGAGARGVVLDEAGRPISGAEVELYRLDAGLVTVLTTDAEGRFAWAAGGLAQGQLWKLRAVARGYATGETGWIELARNRYQSFRLAAKTGDLSITVRDGAGDPFGGYEITVTGPYGVVLQEQMTGAGTGLQGVPTGSYTIAVAAPGYAAAVRTVEVAAGRRATATVTVEAAGLRASGEVRDNATGAPVWGARAWLLREDATLVGLAYTDEGGLFQFDLPEGAGGSYKLLVTARGYRNTTTNLQAAAGGRDLDWSGAAAISLEPLHGTITGMLLRDEGEYMPRLPVVLERKGYGKVAEVTADDKGQFRFDAVLAGPDLEYRVVVNKDQFVAATPWAPIRAGVTTDVILKSRPAVFGTVGTGSVAGLVTDPNGAPVAGAQLELLNRGNVIYRGQTRTDGTFLFEHVNAPIGFGGRPGEPYTLRVSKDGYATVTEATVGGAPVTEFQVVPEARTVVSAVLYPAAASLRGRIVDARGRGIAGATVWVRAEGDQYEAKVSTDAAGWYKADGAPAGAAYRYTVSAEAKGFVPVEGIAAGPVVRTFQALPTLTLASARTTVMGRVQGPDGTPRTGLTVTLRSQGKEIARAVTDEGGNYRLSGVTIPRSGGSLLLTTAPMDCCTSAAAEVTGAELRAAAGGAIARDLVVYGHGGLTGQALGPDGAALAGVEIEIVADGMGVVGIARTDETGTYRFVNLPTQWASLFWVRPGKGEVRSLHLPGHEGEVPVVRVAPGETSVQDLLVK